MSVPRRRLSVYTFPANSIYILLFKDTGNGGRNSLRSMGAILFECPVLFGAV